MLAPSSSDATAVAESPGFRESPGPSRYANGRARLDIELELGLTENISCPSGVLVAHRHVLLDSSLTACSREPPVNAGTSSSCAAGSGSAAGFGNPDAKPDSTRTGSGRSRTTSFWTASTTTRTSWGMQDRKSAGAQPNLDAVQEFQVETSNYSAEFGQSAGAVVNVSIKSGSNVVHGRPEFCATTSSTRDAFDYHDRRRWKADLDALRQNQWVRSAVPCERAGPSTSRARRARYSHDRKQPGHGSNRARTFGLFDRMSRSATPSPGRSPGNVIPRERWDPVAAHRSAGPEPTRWHDAR